MHIFVKSTIILKNKSYKKKEVRNKKRFGNLMRMWQNIKQ